jgi:hypothetical protein
MDKVRLADVSVGSTVRLSGDEVAKVLANWRIAGKPKHAASATYYARLKTSKGVQHLRYAPHRKVTVVS